MGKWRWEVVLLGQLLILGLVIASIVRRRSAWKAWVVFGSSFLIADLVAATGRASLPTSFALNSLYWLFYGFLFWAALGLAFMPNRLPGSEPAAPQEWRTVPRHAKHRKPSVTPAMIGVMATVALCALGIHYLWKTPDRSLGADNASFIHNVRDSWQTVSKREPTAFVWDSEVPAYVLAPIFSPYNHVSSTVGLVVTGIRMDATHGPGYLVRSDGELQLARRAVIANLEPGAVTAPVGQGEICLARSDTAKLYAIPLTATVPKGDAFVRITYSKSSGFSMVFDSQTLHLGKGDGSLLVPWTYSAGSSVFGFALPARSSICLSIDVEHPVPADN